MPRLQRLPGLGGVTLRTRVAVAHYGSGNIVSVSRALARLGIEPVIVTSPTDLDPSMRGLILPGVGAFRSCMARLQDTRWCAFLQGSRLLGSSSEPLALLGICVGFQVFAQFGTEGGSQEGIGLLTGSVGRLSTDTFAQHVGWDSVTFRRPFLGFGAGQEVDFYFDHGYGYPPLAQDCAAVGMSDSPFCAAAQTERIWGVQFHPERSGEAGLELLEAFAAQVHD